MCGVVVHVVLGLTNHKKRGKTQSHTAGSYAVSEHKYVITDYKISIINPSSSTSKTSGTQRSIPTTHCSDTRIAVDMLSE